MTPFRAPEADGGLLTLPTYADFGPQLDANARLLANAPVQLAGVPLRDVRTLAADEVHALATQYHRHFGEALPPTPTRYLVGGHQPELFHAGVWAKNFALHAWAKHTGRTPLNLIVDNDTIKSAEVRLPVLADDPAQVTLHTEAFDHLPSEIPYEEYRVHDRATFANFAHRLETHTHSWGYTPAIQSLWPEVTAMTERGCAVGNVFAAVRRQRERRWGVTNVELPVSRLAETQAFRLFTVHVLTELPAFHEAYNGAIRAYRLRNHLRSKNHPAPELTRQDAWLEAPFWVWHTTDPTRRKLFVRRTEAGFELRGQDTPMMIWRGSTWDDLTNTGWKLRPRALTLTLFVRLCVADGFMHGIGGGKYDEVTDELVRRFFAIEPPSYAVVSATLRLPLPTFPTTRADLQQAQRTLRDLHWNPQYASRTQQALPSVVQAKEMLAAQQPVGRAARRQWFRDLQQVTTTLRPAVADEVPRAQEHITRCRTELAANSILRRRDYAWPLFPETLLQRFFTRSFNIDER